MKKFKSFKKIIITSLLVSCSLISSFTLAANQSPYNLVRFQAAIDDSKLQSPTSTPPACSSLDTGLTSVPSCVGYSDQSFRLDDTGRYMTFEMQGKGNRSELRQLPEWLTSTTTWRKMIGEVKIFYPATLSLNQFTVMQVHDSGSYPNIPLVRIVWLRSHNNKADHLWAAIHLSQEPNGKVKWVDIGARTNGFSKIEIKVKDNYLSIRRNDKTFIRLNVDYWDGLNSYFKAGVYLQDIGKVKVQYRKLNYYYQ